LISLKASGLRKSFFQGDLEIPILKGLNLEATTGKSVAILGKSGSGKSTLLSLLAGLDKPDQGDLIFDGVSYASMSEEELTLFRGQRMGIIFQQFHLLPHLSAVENVSLAAEILNRPNAHALALEALKKVGLSHRENHHPLKLSGGEKQRVAIARALVIRPSLLLADEPSGSLDEVTGAEVMDLLFELVQGEGTGLILVTHSLELAKRCDEILRLDDGVLKQWES
jgi:putative ABC transport system ATP-binding protein